MDHRHEACTQNMSTLFRRLAAEAVASGQLPRV